MNEISYDKTVQVALIVGSVREPRMADPLLAWLHEELATYDWLDLDTVDLATVPLPPHELQLAGSAASPISSRLHGADAFLVLTPEYNHSYPSSLKNAIDWHHSEWAYKPIAFIGYGAGSGGVRAIEHLRVIFSELRATTTREALLLNSPWEGLDDTGRFVADDDTRAALDATLRELRWWAQTLRAGRAALNGAAV